MNELQMAAGWLREAERIAVFTGAGISAESGIATFRDAGGFWQRYPPEQFATWGGILNLSARNPGHLADFFLELLTPIAEAAPNGGHLALAELEKYCQEKFKSSLTSEDAGRWFNQPLTLITQNVDGLHQEAGSRNVKEIHGTLFEIVTESAQRLGMLSRAKLHEVAEAIQTAKDSYFKETSLAMAVRPMMGLGPEGFYRPNLVLFGDGMNEPDWSEAVVAARECDVFLTVGTSGMVYPAAMLPHEAAAHGAKCISVDPVEESGDIWLEGTAGEVLPALVARALGNTGSSNL